jgi:MYXO-CTERM domain-containing protein
MAEHVAMRLLKKELATAPGTAYAKVTIHTEDKPDGEYHGVYILLEDIDKSALRRRFGPDDGRLVKNSKDACAASVEFDDGPPNAAKAAWDAWYPSAPGSLAAADKAFDLEGFLRQEAIREILVNGDDTAATSVSTGGMGLNWYYYDPRAGVRQFIPWDTDLTFGQQNENCAPNSLKCPPTERVGRWCGNPSNLGRVTVCHNAIRPRYLEIMCQLTNGSMAADEILKVWEEAYQTVKDVVPLEKDIAWGGRDPSDPSINKSFGAEYIRLKSWIPARIRSVQQQISCAAGCPAGKVESCKYLGCEGQRRCENNKWTTCQPMGGSCTPAPPATDGGAPTPGTDGGAPGSGGAAGGGGNASGGSSGGGNPGTGGSSGGGTAGSSGGGAGSSGMAGSGGPRPGAGGSSGPSTPPAGGKSGGCALGGQPGGSGGAGFLVLLALAMLGRRRRR